MSPLPFSPVTVRGQTVHILRFHTHGAMRLGALLVLALAAGCAQLLAPARAPVADAPVVIVPRVDRLELRARP